MPPLPLRPRQSHSEADQFLDLISNPFQTEIQVNSIYASIVWAFAVSGALFVLFILLRTRNGNVYAPRAKHADARHAPARLAKTAFGWIKAVREIDERDLVDRVGLDAVVFLRFLRMLRNIFVIFSILGCSALIPLNLAGTHSLYPQWSSVATLMKFTPQYIFGQRLWGYVGLAYVFQFVLFYVIWMNYRAVLKLRRRYFESLDYQLSLHARTLLVTRVPRMYQSDEGIGDIARAVKPTEATPKTVVARNARELPHLIEQHDKAVRQLENYLAQYLKNPNILPTVRPKCTVAKEDKRVYGNRKMDAIDYLQHHIRRLREEIEAIRKSVDFRDTMPYGFASYSMIEDAHATAYASRKKGPHGAIISLAPKPNDLIWKNLPMSQARRRTRRFWYSFWMISLTVAFIPLNILSSAFLSDFSHLGLLWADFNKSLKAHPVGWGVAQGILAPTFQYLIFLGLPTVFRRLYNHSGDISKTARERHVMAGLYAFFVVNNLIVFSVFGSAFRFLASVIQARNQSLWDTIKNAHIFTNLMAGLCNVSTFWLTYQMQQNLGAAVDIAQLLPLIIWWFKRNFTHSTPRQLIEASAPPPFDYASYYNSYLYVATVGMAIGILQPIIFPITAFYLFIELFFKRYILQYVAITKTESGGLFWQVLINRLLVANVICNAVITLIVGAQGVGAHDLIQDAATNSGMLYAMVPLPILILMFKWYCSKAFDRHLGYYSTTGNVDGEDIDGTPASDRRADRVAVRFGHPALYQKLIKPMVDAKAQHLMREILSPEFHKPSVDFGTVTSSMSGYSDLYMVERDVERKSAADRLAETHRSFEFVQEKDMDFANFKARAEFRSQFGGDGELYSAPEDILSHYGSPPAMRTLRPDVPLGAKKRSIRPSQESFADSFYDEIHTARQVDVVDFAEATDYFQPMELQVSRVRGRSVDIAIPSPNLHGHEIVNAAAIHKH